MRDQKSKGGFDSITSRKSFLLKRSKPAIVASEEKTNITPGEKEIPDTKTKHKFKFIRFKKQKPFSLHGVMVIILLLPIFLFGAGSYLYQIHNEGRIYDGVRVLGVDAGGMTKEDLSKMLDRKIGGYKLTIQGEKQTFTATEAALGITYDRQQIIKEAYNFGRDGSVLGNFNKRAESFLSRYNITLAGKTYALKQYNVATPYVVDNNKLNQFLAGIEAQINVDAKDSRVTTDGGSMKIIPAVFGAKLETADLKNKILKESADFGSAPIKLKTDVTSPAISDEKTRILAEKADQVTSKSITLTYQGKTFSPSKETVVSWVTFTRTNDQADWQMVIDQSKMASYIDTIGNAINVYSVPQKIRVENETKEIVTQQGKDGLIIDKAALENQIDSKLQTDPQVNLVIPMEVDHYQTQRDYVVVANWDKYIDINLATQHMDAYLKGGVRVGSWAITSGRDALSTPTGQFLILRKAYDVCMPNPPYSKPLCGIHFVSYFTNQGHAIHEAWWRGYFGGQDYHWDGSHGCINAPFSVAEFIYNWAPIGTPVTIHY